MAIGASRLGILRLPSPCASGSRQRPHGSTLAGGRHFGFLMVRLLFLRDSAALVDHFQASVASLFRHHDAQ